MRKRIATLCVLFTIASCSSSPKAPDPTLAFGRVEALLWSAKQTLIYSCVNRSGFSYTSPSHEPGAMRAFDFPDYPSQIRAVGTGLTQSAIDGLSGKALRDLQQFNSDPNQTYVAALSVSERNKFETIVSDCSSAAAESLSLLNDKFRSIISEFAAVSVSPNVGEEESLRQRFEPEWRSCMTLRGFELKSIEDLGPEIQRRIGLAGNDVGKLQDTVLQFDKAISAASWQCDAKWRLNRGQLLASSKPNPAMKVTLERIGELETELKSDMGHQPLLAS